MCSIQRKISFHRLTAKYSVEWREGEKPHEERTERFSTKGSMAGNIMGMAMPMMLAQLINLLYSVVDRVYIGRIPM